MSTDSIESLSLKIDYLSARVESLEEEVKELKGGCQVFGGEWIHCG